MMDIFKAISLAGIIIGSYTDFRTLEVPDWINYFLIASGIGGNIIFSLVENNPQYIIRSFLGLAAALAVGYGMYYTGQWGGGDSKMLFGLGALLGVSYPFRLDFFFIFMINLVFAGALYGLIWVFVKGLIHRKKVMKELKKYLKEYSKSRRVSSLVIFALVVMLIFIKIHPYYKMVFAGLLLVLFLMNYLLALVKAVEEAAMIKVIDIDKLTEGDWIVEPVHIGKKYITGPKELGIKKEQIALLMKYKKEGKISKIKVKYGIPFVPSFLISFVFTLFTGNIIFFAF